MRTSGEGTDLADHLGSLFVNDRDVIAANTIGSCPVGINRIALTVGLPSSDTAD